MYQIELADANDLVTKVTLDGDIYYLHFAWSGTMWTLDVRDSNNIDIVRGIAVRANYPLLLPYSRLLPLKGQLLVIINAKDLDITRSDFVEGRAKLVYMTAEEVEAIATSIS